MRIASLDEAQTVIKIASRNTNYFRYAYNTTLMAESKELKSLLMKGERGEWKSWLKTQQSENEDHGIHSHHFMANSWGNTGNSDRLYFLGLQNHCRWWLQPWNKKTPAPWEKGNAKPRQCIKSRGVTLPTKVCLVKAMAFQVVVYGCESWTIKKAECQRIDAFELRCWRRLLRVLWIAWRSNQSIRKEISPKYSLKGLMLKLKV